MTKHDHGLKEKVEGAIDKVKGEVKEVVGKVTDNKKLQAEGKWDKVKGTAKDTVGNVKEKVHEYKEHKKEIKKSPSALFYFPSFFSNTYKSSSIFVNFSLTSFLASPIA